MEFLGSFSKRIIEEVEKCAVLKLLKCATRVRGVAFLQKHTNGKREDLKTEN